MALIAVENAGFSYGRQVVFDDLSFKADAGEVFCLLGPNGCGKTTLLDCILGFHRLRSGSIHIMGKDAGRIRSGQVARSVAYVPQSHKQTFPYTVREIVTMGRAVHLGPFGVPSEGDAGLAADALNRIGAYHLIDKPYTQLSGGETQLVMIARALVQETPAIIMDEPTSHLDFKYELAILELIVDLVQNDRLLILMATHFPNHAFFFESQGIKTSAAFLSAGRFLSVGSPGQVVTAHQLRAIYGVNARVIAVDRGSANRLKQIIPLSTAGKIGTEHSA